MRPCRGMRVAGTPSFWTKRWVFSDTLEKYTRLPTALSQATRSPLLSSECGVGERLDAIRPEARPVLVSGHDDRGLQVAQRHDIVARLRVKTDVHLFVG